MAKPFSDLRARMSSEAQAAAAKKAQMMLDEMSTHFPVSMYTGYPSIPSEGSALGNISSSILAPIDRQGQEMQGQSRSYEHIVISGASSGTSTQKIQERLGSIFGELGHKKHPWLNLLEDMVHYGTFAHP